MIKGYQPEKGNLDRTDPPKSGSGVPTSAPHPVSFGQKVNEYEIRDFILESEDLIYIYQTDPFIHAVLARAQQNKTTVADLLEDMLVRYYTMSKKQSDELLKTYSEHNPHH